MKAIIRARKVLRNDQLVLGLLAIAIGVIAAVAEILFRGLMGLVQWMIYGSSTAQTVSLLSGLPWYHVLLGPAVGGLLIGFLSQYVLRLNPQGVAQVIEAAALRGGRMSLRTGLSAAVLSATSIGAGASTGREGPIVHLGAAVSSWIAQRLGLSQNLTRTLLGCGIASAVAASFNAPIAGVFFALEVVIGHYALSAFAPIVIAAVAGTVVSRLHYGDFPAFVLPQTYSIASFWEFPAFILLGVVCAVVAMVFMRAIFWTQTRVQGVPLPLWARPAVAGLMVGAIAIWFPEVLGVGYQATDQALRETLTLEVMLLLIVAKTAATAISLAGGFGGGVFSPSLFLGAMTGGAFGLIATGVFPELSSGHGAYTLVGMGAVAGAVLGAPISTILIVFEMTGDYALTIALMVAVVVASTVVEQTLGKHFFHMQLERQGINIKGGREIGLLAQLRVGDVMKRDYSAIEPEAPLEQLREKLRNARYGEVLVMDDEARLVGVVTMADLAHPSEAARTPQVARDVARRDAPVLEADDEVRVAMRLMDREGESHIPVVAGRRDRQVVGFVHEHDVMAAYYRVLMEARAEETGVEPRDLRHG